MSIIDYTAARKDGGDPDTYYASPEFNSFGIKAKGEKVELEGDEYDRFIKLNQSINENSFENKLAEERHSRDMFVMSVTKPLEFLGKKDALLKSIEKQVKELRKNIFKSLVDGKVGTKKADSGSSYCANVVYNVLKDYINREIFPSTIEQSIMEKRVGASIDKLSSPLGHVINEKIRAGESKLTEEERK